MEKIDLQAFYTFPRTPGVWCISRVDGTEAGVIKVRFELAEWEDGPMAGDLPLAGNPYPLT